MTHPAQKQHLCSKAILAAAVALISSSAFAQYQIDTRGRSQDANNMLGSGGYNGQMPIYSNQGNQVVTGNQIITGNVTGGKEFRGFVPYGDPMAFRGNTTGRGMDDFVKNSNGVPSPYSASQQPYGGTQPFYGASRGVAPPAGFVQEGNTGAFVPKPMPAMQNQSDTRLGAINNGSLTQQQGLGDALLPGAVDATARTAPVTGNALMGVNGVNGAGVANKPLTASEMMNNQADVTSQMNTSNSEAGMGGVGLGLRDQTDAFGRSSEQRDRMSNTDFQRELKKLNTQDKTAVDPNAPLDARLSRPLDASVDSGVLTNRQNAASLGMNPLNAGLSTDESTRQRLRGEVAQASPILSEMQRRYVESHPVKKTDAELNREFRREKAAADEKQLKKDKEDALMKSVNRSNPADNNLVAPDRTRERINDILTKQPNNNPLRKNSDKGTDASRFLPNTPKAIQPEPLDINSLPEGMKPSPLTTALTDAEKLMRQGKFQSALEQYDEAAKLAPASPLVTLGRAHAELGASYYARAERDLRAAFQADPALLVGRYNLKQFMGQERLDFLMKDLREIATAEPNQSRPLFLLAYLSYQAGNSAGAAQYLTSAERVAGKADPVFQLLRENWKLPDQAAPAQPAPAPANATPAAPTDNAAKPETLNK